MAASQRRPGMTFMPLRSYRASETLMYREHCFILKNSWSGEEVENVRLTRFVVWACG